MLSLEEGNQRQTTCRRCKGRFRVVLSKPAKGSNWPGWFEKTASHEASRLGQL